MENENTWKLSEVIKIYFENLVQENLLILDIEEDKKENIIKKLVSLLGKAGILESESEFFKVVMEREKKGPTGLEEGLAIPHGKSSSVKELKIAVARLNKRIYDWESADESNEVDLVFLIAIPEDKKGDNYIEVLYKIATTFMAKGFARDLRMTKTKQEFLDKIINLNIK